MTQDEIIRMAQEAGLICEIRPVTAWMESTDLTPYLTRFAALVAAHIEDQQYALGYLDGMSAGKIEGIEAEREACAKMCDHFGEWRDTSGVECAAAIRNRSNK